MFFEISGKTRDLFELIFLRNGDEDGFVEAATDKFDLATLDHSFQAREIFGTMLFDPGEKRSGIVQADMDAGVLFEMFDEGEIGRVVRFFENMLEIAAGLVGVDEQGEMEILGHGDCFFSLA
jgi:hypothetical protein